jgi:hypothetical protein
MSRFGALSLVFLCPDSADQAKVGGENENERIFIPMGNIPLALVAE